METNNIKNYEDYICKQVKGFKFDSRQNCAYTSPMDNYIGVVGTIVEFDSLYGIFGVQFKDDYWYYPADLVVKQLEQKEELVEMMEKDEESDIYNDDSVEPIIKKGDIYHCIKDYTMERGNVTYKKGNYYVSEQDECLTDEEGDAGHIMPLNNEFYNHFTKLERENPYFVGESSSNKEQDMVNNPSHYQLKSGIQVIDIIEGAGLGFHLANVIKYVLRAGKKDPSKELEDLKKAEYYLHRKIKQLENNG